MGWGSHIESAHLIISTKENFFITNHHLYSSPHDTHQTLSDSQSADILPYSVQSGRKRRDMTNQTLGNFCPFISQRLRASASTRPNPTSHLQAHRAMPGFIDYWPTTPPQPRRQYLLQCRRGDDPPNDRDNGDDDDDNDDSSLFRRCRRMLYSCYFTLKRYQYGRKRDGRSDGPREDV